MVPRFATILVTTDFSDVANEAVPFAYSVAEPGGEVHLLHIIEHHNVPNPMYAHYQADELNIPEKRQEVTEKVEEQLNALIPKGATEKQIRTTLGVGFHAEVAAGIVQEAKARKANCVVIGSHGRSGLRHLLLGSVAEEVLRHCGIPLLIVPLRRD